jgi:hypothetical protein
MKTSSSSIVLGTALVVVAGLFAVTVSGLITVNPIPSANTLGVGAYLTGHVESTLRDADGNVKEYRQSDNVITNTGENCVARLLFAEDGSATGQGAGSAVTGPSQTSGTCNGALQEPWNKIAIGTSTTKANGTNYLLGSELTSPSGLARGIGSITTWTNSTGNAANSFATVILEKTFSNTGTAVQVAESGLFNSTTANSNGMFARQNFTAITVGNGDSLTVRWTINIGGTQFTLSQST